MLVISNHKVNSKIKTTKIENFNVILKTKHFSSGDFVLFEIYMPLIRVGFNYCNSYNFVCKFFKNICKNNALLLQFFVNF